MASAVAGYVAGALLIALIAGVATYIVLSILGVPFRGPLALIAGLFSLIPLVGATIAAVLIGLVTVFEDFPTTTIIWVIWAIAYQQFENHVIQPQVQKRTVNVQPFITIVAVLFGATLLGVLGALVAIPIAASIQILLREYVDLRTMTIKAHPPAAAAATRAAAASRRPRRPPRRPTQRRRSRALSLPLQHEPGSSRTARVLLAITAVSLYLLAPALLEVFGAYDRLDEFNPLWWIAMVALQIGSYACMWAVQKIAMRAEHWGPVITSQLASNSFGRVVPGGVAAAGAMQYAMLARGGVPAAPRRRRG